MKFTIVCCRLDIYILAVVAFNSFMGVYFSDEVFVLYSCSFETDIETCSIYNHGKMKWRKHSVCFCNYFEIIFLYKWM